MSAPVIGESKPYGWLVENKRTVHFIPAHRPDDAEFFRDVPNTSITAIYICPKSDSQVSEVDWETAVAIANRAQEGTDRSIWPSTVQMVLRAAAEIAAKREET